MVDILFWFFVLYIPSISIVCIEVFFEKRERKKQSKHFRDERVKRLIHELRSLSQEEKSKIEDIKPGLLEKMVSHLSTDDGRLWWGETQLRGLEYRPQRFGKIWA